MRQMRKGERTGSGRRVSAFRAPGETHAAQAAPPRTLPARQGGVDEILDDRNIYIRLPRAGGRGEKLGVNPIPVEPRLPRAGEGVRS